MTNAKASIATAGLESDLMQIKVCYSPLAEMLKKTESTHYLIQDAYEDITSLNLDRDPAKITEYVKKRIENHEIHSITQLTTVDLKYFPQRMACYRNVNLLPLVSNEVFQCSENF